MGSANSTPVGRESVPAGRLKDLSLQEKMSHETDSEYVNINRTPAASHWSSQTVSIAAAEDWEKQLLASSKVIYQNSPQLALESLSWPVTTLYKLQTCRRLLTWT
jgi:hypothetical protein